MGVLTSEYAGLLTVVIMLAIGTTMRAGDLVAALRRPKALLLGLAGQQLLVPLIGLALAMQLADGTACLSLALVAVVSGGVSSNFLTAAAGGEVALSALLTFFSNLMVAIWLPFLLGLAATACKAGAIAADLDYVQLALKLAAVSALPILAGVALVHLLPKLMARLRPYLMKLASVLFLVIVAWILWDDRANLMGYVTAGGLLIPALMLGAGCAGLLAGRLLRIGRRASTALAFEWAVQNVPLAILVALTLGAATASPVPAAAYGVLQLVLGLVAAVLLRRGNRGERAAA